MSSRLNCLKDDWRDVKEIILFGWGRQGKKMYETLSKEFQILKIVDNDINKQGQTYGKHTIESLEAVQTLLHQYKIVVTTAQYYYKDIKLQLEGIGLTEYVDFVMYQQFITEWFCKFKNKINVIKIDVPITSRCTLKCENCMQFLPYWKCHKDYPIESIENSIKVFFDSVDYLFDMDIVGGEPFLYKEIERLISYIGENYRHKMGYVGFITNGTVLPKANVLDLIAKYGFEVSISDYTGDINYHNCIDALIEELKVRNIRYTINKSIPWYDFGFPKDMYHYNDKQAVEHMRACNPLEHILDDGKLFYCGMQWSAQKGELFEREGKAFLDLAEIDRDNRKDILELVLGNIKGGYLDFCKVCGGFGIDNNNRVETAKQIRGRNHE